MEHGKVVFGLFGPANKQVAEAIEPRMGALHDPAPGLLARFFGLRFFAAGPKVDRVAQFGHHVAHLGVIAARIQAQVLVMARRPVSIAGGFSRGW